MEVLKFIISTCMLASIAALVATLILNVDIYLEIVGEIVYWFNKRVIEPVRFWIWEKTHKDELIQIQIQVQEMQSKEPTYELPGWKTDEVSAALKSWAMAFDSVGELQKKELESWAKCIAHSYKKAKET